jgi:hypothetical protein
MRSASAVHTRAPTRRPAFTCIAARLFAASKAAACSRARSDAASFSLSFTCFTPASLGVVAVSGAGLAAGTAAGLVSATGFGSAGLAFASSFFLPPNRSNNPIASPLAAFAQACATAR